MKMIKPNRTVARVQEAFKSLSSVLPFLIAITSKPNNNTSNG
jgi:hypothetical protein